MNTKEVVSFASISGRFAVPFPPFLSGLRSAVLPWPGFLFFCEDSPSIGQVDVRESPVTSHFSLWLFQAACYSH